MSLLQRLHQSLSEKAYPVPQPMGSVPQVLSEYRMLGNEISIYPEDTGERYIRKGYQLNDSVFSIVNKNLKKCRQIRFYPVKISRNERSKAREYTELSKGSFSLKKVQEMAKLQKAMTEDRIVDSPLAKILNKPNRYQMQAAWIGNLVGHYELTGEGNVWANENDAGVPIELFVIPKSQLNLVGDGRSPFDILSYEFILSGNTYRWETDKVFMWRYDNVGALDVNLSHLRGLAPLHSGMILVQGMNEADLRIAISNKNGGAAGLLYRSDAKAMPSETQITDMRRDVNNAVNSREMAGKIAMMAGEWGYHNFSVTVNDQKLLEQYGIGFKRLCRLFNTPPGIFAEQNDTYENVKQYKRDWVYDKIAPTVYNLRDELNAFLLPKFGLDAESYMIDCDVLSLQELSEDLKDQVDAVKEAWWLTPNQRLDIMGYEQSLDPNMNKIYIPSTYTTLDQLNDPMGGSLDQELNLLNPQND
jgi:HK97 family phage portal protein